MKVSLVTDDNFKVTPLSSLEQDIASSGYTEWKFEVLPLRAGDWDLHFTITAMATLKPSGETRYKDLPNQDVRVHVRVEPAIPIIKRFVQNDWQWLWTTLAIPALAWIWKKRR